MNRLVRILAITTLAFAASTGYYALALQKQRHETAQVTASTTYTPTARPGTAAPATQIGNATTGGDAVDDAAIKIVAARARLSRYTDPDQRIQIAARTRTQLADTWKPIAASMQLPSYELDRLLDFLADQATRFDQCRLECQVDPQCDLQALNGSLKDTARQNLAHELGPARFEKWNAYRESIPERVYIEALRKELSGDGALTDAQTEKLVLALAEERRRYVERAAQLGRKIQVSSAGFTVQEFQGDLAPRPFGPSNKEMTKDFNNGLRNVAARLLNQEQLAAFTKLQDERLKNSAFMEALSSHTDR